MGDLVNGLFECLGGLFLILNIRRLMKDKSIKGISPLPTMFFTSWGYWSLYYYPSLNQWFSFTGGLVIVVMNTIWIGLLCYYARRSRLTV